MKDSQKYWVIQEAWYATTAIRSFATKAEALQDVAARRANPRFDGVSFRVQRGLR